MLYHKTVNSCAQWIDVRVRLTYIKTQENLLDSCESNRETYLTP